MKIKQYDIRTYVAWLMLLPLLVMVICMEAFFLHERYVDLDFDLLTRGQLIARQLAASSEYGVFSNNHSFLKNLADNALKLADVSAVAVMNANSKILVASGDMQNALVSAVDIPGNAEKLPVSREEPSFDNGKTLLLYQPILSSELALDENDQADIQYAGAVVIEMSWKQTRALKSHLLWLTLWVTTAFLLVILYLVHLASRRIIEPVKNLSAAIGLIGAGNLETRVTVPSCINELNTLINGINQMTADLQHERDILQSRIDEATLQLRGLAFYDPLTMLPNRRLLNDRLTQALAASRRSGDYGALMFLDLDNFKPLNDQFGHETGDFLLVEAARRISSCLREVDTVARFGGDEFVVMLEKLNVDYDESVNEAYLVADKIRSILANNYSLISRQQGQADIRIEHPCTVSIGVVLFLDHEISQEQILICADMAMYQAKQQGRNRICFYEHVNAVSCA